MSATSAPKACSRAGMGALVTFLLLCAGLIFSDGARANMPSTGPVAAGAVGFSGADTPSPTPAASSTSTRTPLPTQTSTATPTACLVEFTDVPPDNVFYPYIMCLACHGFVIGYDDGTFRPNSDATRGQLCKIVANTAGYSEPIPEDRQTYEDVPPGSTFWLYTERLTAGYVVGGYPCGSVPEEPCVPPQNRPYFRVNNSAIRGQVAKVVCIVVACQAVSGTQTFEDVPYGHVFYPYVEPLGKRQVATGYPCGGPGEPCIAPENRPYFRPHRNTTRGQLTKLVAEGLGLDPPCQFPAGQR